MKGSLPSFVAVLSDSPCGLTCKGKRAGSRAGHWELLLILKKHKWRWHLPTLKTRMISNKFSIRLA